MSLKNIVKKVYRSLPVGMQCRLDSLRHRGSLKLRRGVYVHPSVHLLGRSFIDIGENSCVSEGTWLNVNHRDGDHARIRIGSNCFIGKRNFFTSGAFIEMGDFCLTAVDAKFLGSSHVVDDPFIPHIFSGTTRGHRIVLGANCFVGAGASIVGNVSVGEGSVIGAASVVTKDVPPFSMVAGNPARVLKRYSFVRSAWLPLADFSPADEAAMPRTEEYVKRLRSGYARPDMPVIACGKSLGDL